MPAPRVRAEHSQLSQISRQFDQERDAIQKALQLVQQHVEQLQGGGWKGKAATAFYREMNGDVLPTLKRLEKALEQASRITTRISQRMRAAEADASAVLDGDNVDNSTMPNTDGGGGAGVGGGAEAGTGAGAGGGGGAGTGGGAEAGTGAGGGGTGGSAEAGTGAGGGGGTGGSAEAGTGAGGEQGGGLAEEVGGIIGNIQNLVEQLLGGGGSGDGMGAGAGEGLGGDGGEGLGGDAGDFGDAAGNFEGSVPSEEDIIQDVNEMIATLEGNEAGGSFDGAGGFEGGGSDTGGFDGGGFDAGGFDGGDFDSGGFDSGGFDSGGYESGSYDGDGSYGSGSFDGGYSMRGDVYPGPGMFDDIERRLNEPETSGGGGGGSSSGGGGGGGSFAPSPSTPLDDSLLGDTTPTGGGGGGGGGGGEGLGGGGNFGAGGGASFGAGAPMPVASPLIETPPAQIFSQDYMRNFIGTQIQGAGSPEMRAALMELARNPQGADLERVLARIAELRGVPLDQLKADYAKFQEIHAEAVATAAANGEPPPPSLAEVFNADHIGSLNQLRTGKVIGDVFGIDPVFGALLNPTGGLSDGGTVMASESGGAYNEVFTDAADYLADYHNSGPGESYLGTEGPSGVNFFAEQLGRSASR